MRAAFDELKPNNLSRAVSELKGGLKTLKRNPNHLFEPGPGLEEVTNSGFSIRQQGMRIQLIFSIPSSIYFFLLSNDKISQSTFFQN